MAFVARCGFPKVQVNFLPSYLRRDANPLKNLKKGKSCQFFMLMAAKEWRDHLV